MNEADTRRVLHGLECAKGYAEGYTDLAFLLNLINGAIQICEQSLSEWHDDKPDERAGRFVTTVEGDLDTRGRTLKPGR